MGPPPAVAAVRSAVRTALAPLRPSARRVAPHDGQDPFAVVLVACSGGADSLALAAAVAFEAPRAGLAAGLVTVDHRLQPESDVQARRVAELGHQLGLDPVRTVRVEVGTAGGPEGAARAARYAALAQVAEPLGAAVLLGHTLDDQAETVLLGLGRGSGPRSIVGMAAVDGRYLRPLLGVRRATTERACAELGLLAWHDPHNDDPVYQRVRLRAEVLPLLEQVLQGGVGPALARTADLLRDDLDAVDAWAATVATQMIAEPDPRSGSDPGVDAASLAELPRAVRTRVLRTWTASLGAPALSSERTAALDALLTDWHGQGPIELPGGVCVRRRSGRLEAV